MPKGIQRSNTLCLRCRNSYTNGCSWARDFTPVDGWCALPTAITFQKKQEQSFMVLMCPKFKEEAQDQDERIYHAKPIEDNAGAELLAAAIVKQACRDYLMYGKRAHENKGESERDRIKRQSDKDKQKDIVKWFRSPEFRLISDIDPESIIKRLRFLSRQKLFGAIGGAD